MSREKILTVLLTGAMAAALTISPVPAQEVHPEGPEHHGPPGDSDVREAMQALFDQHLRERLGMTDEQMAAVTPHMREMDRVRFRARHERREVIRALRQGMNHGMGDGELQTLLDRLDTVMKEEISSTERIITAVDRELTVRQRVELRFFMEEFGRRMREKVREIRGGGGRRSGPPHGEMHGGRGGGLP